MADTQPYESPKVFQPPGRPSMGAANIGIRGFLSRFLKPLRFVIVDWYLLREYLKVGFGALTFFVLLYLFFTMVVEVPRLLMAEDKPHATPINITLHYLYQIPYILTLLSPIAFPFAVIFVIGNLYKNHEVVAVIGSGVHLYRYTLSVMIATIMYCIVLFILSDTVVVPLYDESERLDSLIHNRNEDVSKNVERDIIPGENNIIYIVDRYDSAAQEFFTVTIAKERFRANLPEWERVDAESIDQYVRPEDLATEIKQYDSLDDYERGFIDEGNPDDIESLDEAGLIEHTESNSDVESVPEESDTRADDQMDRTGEEVEEIPDTSEQPSPPESESAGQTTENPSEEMQPETETEVQPTSQSDVTVYDRTPETVVREKDIAGATTPMPSDRPLQGEAFYDRLMREWQEAQTDPSSTSVDSARKPIAVSEISLPDTINSESCSAAPDTRHEKPEPVYHSTQGWLYGVEEDFYYEEVMEEQTDDPSRYPAPNPQANPNNTPGFNLGNVFSPKPSSASHATPSPESSPDVTASNTPTEEPVTSAPKWDPNRHPLEDPFWEEQLSGQARELGWNPDETAPSIPEEDSGITGTTREGRQATQDELSSLEEPVETPREDAADEVQSELESLEQSLEEEEQELAPPSPEARTKTANPFSIFQDRSYALDSPSEEEEDTTLREAEETLMEDTYDQVTIVEESGNSESESRIPKPPVETEGERIWNYVNQGQDADLSELRSRIGSRGSTRIAFESEPSEEIVEKEQMEHIEPEAEGSDRPALGFGSRDDNQGRSVPPEVLPMPNSAQTAGREVDITLFNINEEMFETEQESFYEWRITANRLKWHPQKRRWVAYGGTKWIWGNDGKIVKQLSLDNVVLPELEEYPAYFERFRRNTRTIFRLTWEDCEQLINKLKRAHKPYKDIESEMYGTKVAWQFATFFVVFLGLGLMGTASFHGRKAVMIRSLAISLIFFFMYFVLHQLGTSLGKTQNTIAPEFMVHLGNAIFFFTGLVLMRFAKT